MMVVMNECPDYDGIYDGHGPCWTCQGIKERCPLGQEEDERSSVQQ